MKCRRGAVLLCICFAYGLVSLYTAYIASYQPKKASPDPSFTPQRHTGDKAAGQHFESESTSKISQRKEVVIWDTCGLGIYLWRNILHGKIKRYNLVNGWTHDSLEMNRTLFQYNLGYGLSPEKALRPSSSNLVLIINSRAEVHVEIARAWVDHVIKSAYIEQVAIMLRGSESCDDEWILPYLQQSKIKCLFLVFDSPLVDNEFVYQWPLGSAMYKNFPSYGEEFIDLTAERKYIMNFVGTTHEESSRKDMVQVIKRLRNGNRYFIKTRDKWKTEETPKDLVEYQHSLVESDLTLSPAGTNSECYRTYEAMEMGSIPVIEDVLTEGRCGNFEGDTKQVNYTPPYRLLKQYNAPVLYIKNWEKDLPAIVERFTNMPPRVKFQYRINLIRWYVDFKNALKEKFISIIHSKFFYNTT